MLGLLFGVMIEHEVHPAVAHIAYTCNMYCLDHQVSNIRAGDLTRDTFVEVEGF